MATPQKLSRTYGTSDANMLSFAHLIQENLTTDLADFTAFDADFTPVYATDFLTAITAAQSFSSDEQLLGQQVQKTLDLAAEMAACRDYVQMMKYFVEKAFGDSGGRVEEFRLNTYGALRKHQNNLIQFMFDLYETATKYSAELTAVGFDGAKISAIETHANALQAANSAQEHAKGSRSSASDERVALLNAAWDTVRQVRAAAKIMYRHDWGKWQLYDIPWLGAPPQPENAISGFITYGTTLTIPVPDLTANTVLELHNTGDVPLKFCGSETAGMACGAAGLVIQPTDSVSVILQDIAAAGSTPTVLNVSHTVVSDPAPDGRYSVIAVEE